MRPLWRPKKTPFGLSLPFDTLRMIGNTFGPNTNPPPVRAELVEALVARGQHFDKLSPFDRLRMHGHFDKLSPFDRLRMHGHFDKLSANGFRFVFEFLEPIPS
jgi:hypothetical protein